MKSFGNDGMSLRAVLFWSALILFLAWWVLTNWLPANADVWPM